MYDLSIASELQTQAEKNIFYYKRNYLGIKKYLDMHLNSIISKKHILDWMPRIIINDVPRFIDRLCLLYKNPANRTYTGSEDIQTVFEKGLNRNMKEFHRMAKLQNTILVRPLFENGKFTFIVLDRSRATVKTMEDDYNYMTELIYPRELTIKDELVTVYYHWDADAVWVTDKDDNEIRNLPEYITKDLGANPFKEIPFIVLRLRDGYDDFWGDGIPEVVNNNEIISGKLSDTVAKQWMSFGYGIGTNLGIKAADMTFSPYGIIVANDLRSDHISPKLEFVTPDHKVIEDRDLTDWLRKTVGNAMGMSGASMSEQISEMSGYSKQMDNIEIADQNNDDRDTLIEFEFELNRLMNKEYLLIEKKNGVVLSQVNLREYQFPKSTTEIWEEREYQFKYDMSTPEDWVKQDRPDLDEKDIQKLLTDNKAINANYKQKNTTTASTFRDKIEQSRTNQVNV
jgi:hypothetical protein